MNFRDQLAICNENYLRWKKKALASSGVEAQKAFEKAFFWLEVQTAFIVLHSIEQTRPKDEETIKHLIKAKINLSKRLAEYAEATLRELLDS